MKNTSKIVYVILVVSIFVLFLGLYLGDKMAKRDNSSDTGSYFERKALDCGTNKVNCVRHIDA